MEKTIVIDDKEVRLKATAATPVLYRMKYNRDMLMDMQALSDRMSAQSFDQVSLEIFEKVAYIMAKSGSNNDVDFPDDEIEWLDQFNMFSIYEVLPSIVELWGANTKTLNRSKKK